MDKNPEIQCCTTCDAKFVSKSKRCPCCGAAQTSVAGQPADGQSEGAIFKKWLLISLGIIAVLFALLTGGQGIFKGVIGAAITGGIVGICGPFIFAWKSKADCARQPIRPWWSYLVALVVVAIGVLICLLVLYHYQPS